MTAQASIRRRHTAAFSLAELMIALAILGMGLLVISAALPAGLKITKDTVDMGTGAAAAEYALETIAQSVTLRERILWDDDPADPRYLMLERPPTLFVPRNSGTLNDPNVLDGPEDPDMVPDYAQPARLGQLNVASDPRRDYEPLIKVRALHMGTVNAGPNVWEHGNPIPDPANEPTLPVHVEDLVRNWLPPTLQGDPRECDPLYQGGQPGTMGNGPWLRTALPCVAGVYPPINADTARLPGDFLPVGHLGGTAGWRDAQYRANPVRYPNHPNQPGAETTKAAAQRIVWSAFYRRASYAVGSDPALYEFVVVASRLASGKHHFPAQPTVAGGSGTITSLSSAQTGPSRVTAPAPVGSPGGAVGGHGQSRSTLQAGGRQAVAGITATPLPYLVTFSPNHRNALPVLTGYGPGDRLLPPGHMAPATLTFIAGPDVGALLPPGSIFIPAVNDLMPTALNPSYALPPALPVQAAGFVPSAPDVLPIYEVADRVERTDGSFDIVVKYNGFYPWIDAGLTAANWPVWIVPPAVDEVDGNGNPVWPERSSIVAVSRRYIMLPELK